MFFDFDLNSCQMRANYNLLQMYNASSYYLPIPMPSKSSGGILYACSDFLRKISIGFNLFNKFSREESATREQETARNKKSVRGFTNYFYQRIQNAPPSAMVKIL